MMGIRITEKISSSGTSPSINSSKSAMKVLVSHEFMMGGRMVLGEIIGTVEFSRRPVEIELLLGNAIFEPMITHVEGFGFFHANFGVENPVCSGIVGLKRSTGCRLRMAQFCESGEHWDGFLRVEKQTSGFGFRGRGSDCSNGFAENVNCTVGDRIGRGAGGTGKGGEEKVTSSTAAGIGEDKVSGVGADSKNHVTGMVPDGGIGVRGEVVEQHITGLFGVDRGGSLIVGNFIQGDDDGGVTTAGIVEKEP